MEPYLYHIFVSPLSFGLYVCISTLPIIHSFFPLSVAGQRSLFMSKRQSSRCQSESQVACRACDSDQAPK
jgi:hypothetical protein